MLRRTFSLVRRVSCVAVLIFSGCSDDPVKPDPRWVTTTLAIEAEVSELAAGPGGALFAGTTDGLYRSDDDGASWRYLSDGWIDEPRRVQGLAVGVTGRIVCATGAILYVSEDGGDGWTPVAYPAVLENPMLVTEVAIGPERALFLGVGGFGGGVFRSSDLGTSWDHIFINDFNRIDFVMTYLTVLSTEDLVFGTLFDHDFRSTNGGAEWQQLSIVTSVPEYLPPTRDLAQDSHGILFAISPSQVLESTDGGDTWLSVESIPFPTVLALDPQDGLFVGTDLGELFHRRTSESELSRIAEIADLHLVSIAATSPHTVFLAAWGRGGGESRILRIAFE